MVSERETLISTNFPLRQQPQVSRHLAKCAALTAQYSLEHGGVVVDVK